MLRSQKPGHPAKYNGLTKGLTTAMAVQAVLEMVVGAIYWIHKAQMYVFSFSGDR